MVSPTAAAFYFYKSFWSMLQSQTLETPQLGFLGLNGRPAPPSASIWQISWNIVIAKCVRVQYVQLKYNYKTKGYTAQQCWKQSSSRSRNGVCCCIHEMWKNIQHILFWELSATRSSYGKTKWSSRGLHTHSLKRSKLEITCRHFFCLLSYTNSNWLQEFAFIICTLMVGQ